MVKCEVCGKSFQRIQWTHLKTHNLTLVEYKEKYPLAKLEDSMVSKLRASTLTNFIKRHGEEAGKEKWEKYCARQRYTNSFEYFHKKYGWTISQWEQKNKSQGSPGELNGNFGIGYYKVWVEKYGKDLADERNALISIKKGMTGKKLHGIPKTEATKENMRRAALSRINRQGGYVAYNEKSIPIIVQYGQENGYNFQHAENGGEVQICGYSVDGYDLDKNVVIEYNERYHYSSTKRIQRDEYRRNYIMKHLNCKFIVIDFNNNVTIYENN